MLSPGTSSHLRDWPPQLVRPAVLLGERALDGVSSHQQHISPAQEESEEQPGEGSQGLRATENQPFSGEVEFRQWLLPPQPSGEEES